MSQHPVVTGIINYLYVVLWNWAGILLAIDGAVALAERYLGEYLEEKLHKKIHVPKELKWGFAVVVFMLAQGLAYRDLQKENQRLLTVEENDRSTQATLEQENKNLTTRLMEKERPIVLQTTPDPEIQKLLRRQDADLAKLKNAMPSPKKRALQLSNDLLRFLDERMKAQPQFPMPHPGISSEDLMKQQGAYSALYVQWMNETASEERSRFAVQIGEVMQDFQDEKLDTGSLGSKCSFFNGNTFMIQDCATQIGVLAQKLSR